MLYFSLPGSLNIVHFLHTGIIYNSDRECLAFLSLTPATASSLGHLMEFSQCVLELSQPGKNTKWWLPISTHH